MGIICSAPWKGPVLDNQYHFGWFSLGNDRMPPSNPGTVWRWWFSFLPRWNLLVFWVVFDNLTGFFSGKKSEKTLFFVFETNYEVSRVEGKRGNCHFFVWFLLRNLREGASWKIHIMVQFHFCNLQFRVGKHLNRTCRNIPHGNLTHRYTQKWLGKFILGFKYGVILGI